MDYIFVKSTKAGMAEYGSVYARVRVKGQNKKYAIGFTMKETEWLRYRSLQFVSSHLISSLGIRYAVFADVLSQIKINLETNFNPDKAKSIIRSIKATVITGQGFEVEEPISDKQILLYPYILKIYEEYKSGMRMKQGESRKVTKSYADSIKKLATNLNEYMLERRKKLTLDKVDMNFRRDYIQWLSNRGLKPNSINGILSRLRTILGIANDDKLNVCTDFMRKGFVPKKEEVDNIYVNNARIQQLLDADLSSKDTINAIYDKAGISKKRQKEIKPITIQGERFVRQARDLFVVGCLTGQRFSDYSRISTDMYKTINGIVFIELTQEKTRKKIFIPLDKRVDDILKLYGGKVPRISKITLNKHMKYLAEILRWTEKPFQEDANIGGRHNGTRFCDLIASHTARRSFATNAYAANIPLSSIMAITGHSTEQMLRKYLRLRGQEKAIIAANDFAGVIDL